MEALTVSAHRHCQLRHAGKRIYAWWYDSDRSQTRWGPVSRADSSAELFVVLESYADIQPWLERVCNESDAHTHELGFLPRSAFEQFARKGWLYVLCKREHSKIEYVGHLLFDVSYPRAHVRQMYVYDTYRRSSCASLLLKRLRSSLTTLSYISIYARVAEDLVAANAFWQKQQFYVQRSERGGASKKRQILVRCCELNSPQLFPTSTVEDGNPLGLIAPTSSEPPMFLLDLNVLFDASKPRRPRRSDAIGLFQAERMNFCRLAVSDEIRTELERTALSDRQTDPMSAYVDLFPYVPVASQPQTEDLIKELAEIVFSDAVRTRPLNANERSDLKHLAAAINNKLSGLITNDGALLRAAEKIETRFKVQVLDSGCFQSDQKELGSHECFDLQKQDTIQLLSVDNIREADVRVFLSNILHASGSEIAIRWLPHGTQSRIAIQIGVWIASACVGYLTLLSKGIGSGLVARAAIDPSHSQAMECARMLLLYLVDRVAEDGPGVVHLEIPPQQPQLREIAAVLGFGGSTKSQHLSKSILGRVLTSANWPINHNILFAVGGPKLPPEPPGYRGPDQQLPLITPDGNRRHISVDQLESLLSPALLCLDGRPAVITPVRRTFAEPLLGHSRQRQLLPRETASLFQDRKYIGTPRALRHFRRGTLMFFYESSTNGGCSGIVAVARVREAYLKMIDSFEASDLHQSVLDPEQLKKIGKSSVKAVTLFDNIFPFRSPVGLATLRRIGCGRSNDLITTKPINSEQAKAILAEGLSA